MRNNLLFECGVLLSHLKRNSTKIFLFLWLRQQEEMQKKLKT